MSEYDFIVLGGGSAGYAGAATAARLGLKTVVLEGGREVGGLCILRGCMPSKTLLESGHRAEEIRRAANFGLRAEYLGADGAEIRARKRRLIGEFADHRRHQLETGNFEFIRGEAAFRDPHTVEVRLLDGSEVRTLTARAFLIATGSRILWHDIPQSARGADATRTAAIVTSSTASTFPRPWSSSVAAPSLSNWRATTPALVPASG